MLKLYKNSFLTKRFFLLLALLAVGFLIAFVFDRFLGAVKLLFVYFSCIRCIGFYPAFSFQGKSSCTSHTSR